MLFKISTDRYLKNHLSPVRIIHYMRQQNIFEQELGILVHLAKSVGFRVKYLYSIITAKNNIARQVIQKVDKVSVEQ